MLRVLVDGELGQTLQGGLAALDAVQAVLEGLLELLGLLGHLGFTQLVLAVLELFEDRLELLEKALGRELSRLRLTRQSFDLVVSGG
jgi:hypothetical protein